MRLANYHTHTTFCDGKNTCEEMVRAAIDAGMTDIGFSAHAAWYFATEWHLHPSRYTEYIAEVERMKKLYGGQIHILCGFEADYLPGITVPDPAIYSRFSPDFLIGSVHYAFSDKKSPATPLWSIDAPTDEVARGLAECFDNDGKRAAQAYWSAVRDMVSICSFDIIGHLDVLRKRNGTLRFFDEEASWYRRELKKTVTTIAASGKIVELNTGAISRKAMDGIYPSDELLSMLYRHDIPITISSDSHSAEHMVFAYERAREAARKAGYTTLSYKDGEKWVQETF